MREDELLMFVDFAVSSNDINFMQRLRGRPRARRKRRSERGRASPLGVLFSYVVLYSKHNDTFVLLRNICSDIQCFGSGTGSGSGFRGVLDPDPGL